MDHSAQEISYENDAEIDEIILRLDLTLLRPDGDPPATGAEDEQGAAASPAENKVPGAAASSGKSQKSAAVPNDAAAADKTKNGIYTKAANRSSSNVEDKKKGGGGGGGGALDFIRKLRPAAGTTESSKNDAATNKKPPATNPLDLIKVESLPQKFVTKYVGCKACRGLWGIKHTRGPVDSLVDDLKLLPAGEDLALVRVEVSTTGVAVLVHPRTRSRRLPPDLGVIPLEFVSYAVQDTRYRRLFAFILVRELSSRARSTECHAFLGDSAETARRMALSVALAFRIYEKKLAGRPFKFAVDLRPPAELRRSEQTADDNESTFDA